MNPEEEGESLPEVVPFGLNDLRWRVKRTEGQEVHPRSSQRLPIILPDAMPCSWKHVAQ